MFLLTFKDRVRKRPAKGHNVTRIGFYFGLGLLATSAGACATRPQPPTPPPAYAGLPGSEPALSAPPEAAWIESLGVGELTGFVGEALAGNPGLNAAEARAKSARLRARAAGGRFLPDLTLGLGQSRTETPIPGGNDRARVDLSTSQLSASWEADLWGRVLDRTRAQYADARAAARDLDAARLSVAGQTARGWINLIQTRQLAALAEEDLATRQRALEITDRRYARGLTDALSVRTARSQVASARAGAADSKNDQLDAARALQSVLGRYPDGSLATMADIPALPLIGAAGAPDDLLSRRPDVASAEARLDAAGLRASEARKALLPRLSISANANGSGDGIRDITQVDDLVSQIFANLALPLFQGGALRAEAGAAQAEARTAAYNYVETTLGAWREVEGALTADTTLAIRETELTIAAEEAREAQKLAERQYANGVATIFELIDAYSRRIDAERGLIQARAARANNRITYHVALGGGADTGGLAAENNE
jgi:NodT family efflux transporter outer membrane factor (OMF) lipoprotein